MSRPAFPQVRVSLLGWVATLAVSLALSPLFVGKNYLLAAAVLSAPLLVVGIGLRALRAPWYAVVLAQLAGLLMWLTWVWAPGTAAYLVLPTRESLTELLWLTAHGLQAAQTVPAPVAAEPTVLFVTAAGVAGAYLVVDLLGAGLRQVPLVGLPLLALYTVAAAIARDGVPTWSFLLAALAYVALLALEERERLAHWGRQLSMASRGLSEAERLRLNAGALNASAQRIGLAAIAAAAVLPLFLPPFTHNLLARGGGAGPGAGVHVSNPIVDLRRDTVERSTEPAMLVRTDGPAPQYFRLVSLDEFDGERWTLSDRDLSSTVRLRRVLTPPPGLSSSVPARRQRFFVQVAEGFESDWVPAPYAPRQVTGLRGVWRYDTAMLDIVTARAGQNTASMVYAVESLLASPTARQLELPVAPVPGSIGARFRDLPADLPDLVVRTADEVTADATSDFAKAVALQDYFAGGDFEYSLEQADAGHDTDAMVAFLQEKVGYCEQFAATMAVMARLEGIPARVAVGFLRARPVDLGLYQFTYADLHAWPELYFGGVGWVRFEPTAAARQGAVPPDYTVAPAGPQVPERPTTRPDRGPTAAPTPTFPGRQLDPGNLGAAGAGQGGGVRDWWPVAALTGLALLLLPALTRQLLARLRWAGADDDAERAEAAWAELRDSALDTRVRWPRAETPRRTAALLAREVRHDEAATAALARVALAVERARFSRRPTDGAGLRRDVADVRTALWARQSLARRVLALLWPASLPASRRDRAQRRRLARAGGSGITAPLRGGDASALPSGP